MTVEEFFNLAPARYKDTDGLELMMNKLLGKPWEQCHSLADSGGVSRALFSEVEGSACLIVLADSDRPPLPIITALGIKTLQLRGEGMKAEVRVGENNLELAVGGTAHRAAARIYIARDASISQVSPFKEIKCVAL